MSWCHLLAFLPSRQLNLSAADWFEVDNFIWFDQVDISKVLNWTTSLVFSCPSAVSLDNLNHLPTMLPRCITQMSSQMEPKIHLFRSLNKSARFPLEQVSCLAPASSAYLCCKSWLILDISSQEIVKRREVISQHLIEIVGMIPFSYCHKKLDKHFPSNTSPIRMSKTNTEERVWSCC